LQSAPGAGKDIFGKFIASVIGEHHSMTFGDMSQFCQKHNSEQAGKLFIRLNEISDKGINLNNHNLLKNKTTEEEIRIEPKGLEPYNLKNYARYMLFTNNLNSIYLENNDRRYVLIQANNDNANNYDYFTPIYNEVIDKKVLLSAFKYFSTYNIADFRPNVIPVTKYRNEQVLNNLSNVYIFLSELLNGDFDYNNEFMQNGEHIDIEVGKHIKVSLSGLFNLYQKYCKQNCINSVVQNKLFKQKLQTLGIKYSRFRITGERIRGYSITRSEFENLMQKFTNNPSYSIFSSEPIKKEIKIKKAKAISKSIGELNNLTISLN
jgi:phage/plasmid-associated DNA primase